LIGSGFGTASAVNNRFALDSFALANPHSQFVRTLYESGVVGVILLVRAFVSPVKYLTRRLAKHTRDRFFLLTLLLLGCFLGHRSSAPFIYLGVLIAVFRRIDSDREVEASERPIDGVALVGAPSPV
jgi:O-antigen ligase